MSTRKEKYARKKVEAQIKQSTEGTESTTPTSSRLFTKPPASETNTAGIKPGQVNWVRPLPDEHVNKIPGQEWMVLAYVAPEGTAIKSKNVVIKISGAFATESEAENQAKAIRSQAHHTLIGTYVVPLYQFLTIPMPENCKLTCHQKYVDQEVLEKIMEGNWRATEESRKKVQRREQAAKEQNLRNMRAIYGPDYQIPTRSPEEEQKRLQNEKAMLENKPEEEEQKVSTRNAAMMLAEYMRTHPVLSQILNQEKAESASSTSSSSDAAAPSTSSEQQNVEAKPYMTEAMKSFIKGFKEFIDVQAPTMSAPQ